MSKKEMDRKELIDHLRSLHHDLAHFQEIECKEKDVQAVKLAIEILEKVEEEKRMKDIEDILHNSETINLIDQNRVNVHDKNLLKIMEAVINILREEFLTYEEACAAINSTSNYLYERRNRINIKNDFDLIENLKYKRIIERIVTLFEDRDLTYYEAKDILICTEDILGVIAKKSLL